MEDFIARNAPKHQHRRSLLDKAKEEASVEMDFVYKKKPSQSNVGSDLTWPKDWSSTETAKMLINQGGSPGPDGSMCCASNYAAQCQIQSQYSNGMKYFDYTHQRTRLRILSTVLSLHFTAKTARTCWYNTTARTTFA